MGKVQRSTGCVMCEAPSVCWRPKFSEVGIVDGARAIDQALIRKWPQLLEGLSRHPSEVHGSIGPEVLHGGLVRCST